MSKNNLHSARRWNMLSFTPLSIAIILSMAYLSYAKSRYDSYPYNERKQIDDCREERQAANKKLDKFYLIKRGDVQDCYNGVEQSRLINFTVVNTAARRTRFDNEIIQFPGCFDLDASVEILESAKWKSGDPNILAYMSWTLENFEEGFSGLTCKKKDSNGCGGNGNKCYYCDFCETVINNRWPLEEGGRKNVSCPSRSGVPGIQRIIKSNVCNDDWGDLDEDGDGDPDFLCYPEFAPYRDLVEEIGLNGGYGVVSLEVRLATNDTAAYQELKKKIKPSKWKKKYSNMLPKLLEDNLFGCGLVQFDTCTREPLLTEPDSNGETHWYCPGADSGSSEDD